MPDKFLASNAALNPKNPAFEGKSLYLDTKGIESAVQKLAAILAPLKEAKLELVAVDVQEAAFHWLLLLALARLGLASASLPPAEEGITKEAVIALAPDLIISLSHAGELYQNTETMLLNQEWFERVLKEPLRENPKKEPAFSLSESLNRPLRFAMAGASTGGAQPVLMTRKMVREAMSRLLWMDITLALDTVRPIFVSTIHPSSLAGFLAGFAAIGNGAFVRLHDPAHPALAFAGSGPFLAILTPAHLSILLDDLGPRAQTRPEIHLAVSGGIVSDRLIERCKMHLTPNIRIVYATDETGPIAMVRASERRSTRHVGPVLPWAEVKITDEDGKMLPYGESGDIRVKIMDGISAYETPAGGRAAWSGANAHRFHEGWFLTGDRGSLSLIENQEELWVEGRSDDLVTLGGGRFDLSKIDAVLMEDSTISDAASFTYFDGDGSERLGCVVVPAPAQEVDYKSLSLRFHGLYPGLPQLPVFKISKIPRDMYGMPERSVIAQRAKGRIPSALKGEAEG